MKKLILFLALIGFLVGNTCASLVLTSSAELTQISLNEDPPKAKEAKDIKTPEIPKTSCCDKASAKKSCCDDKKSSNKSCCDKDLKDQCKPQK